MKFVFGGKCCQAILFLLVMDRFSQRKPERKHLLNHVPRFEDDAENEQLQSYWKARGRHKNGSFSSVMYLAALVVERRCN